MHAWDVVRVCVLRIAVCLVCWTLCAQRVPSARQARISEGLPHSSSVGGLGFGGAAGDTGEEDEDFGTLVAVSAVRGATARLPCDVTAPNADDPVLLVLWYKNASVTPVYSYDSRGKVQSIPSKDGTSATISTRQGRRRNFGFSTKRTQKLQQWGDEEIWGFPETNTDKETLPESGKGFKNSFLGPERRPRTRAWFDTSTSPAHLLIRDVSGRDEGSYRCKVHFRHSPSWSQRITLSVKDPPGFPRIQTESGARLEGPIGPFEDGTEIRMVCVAAGDPAPRLAWEGPDAILQNNAGSSKASDPPNLIRLKVTASRDTADSIVTCSAVNSAPHNTSAMATYAVEVIIRVNLPPLSVELVVPRSPISGGSESEFVCRAVGARPHTEVQWWLAGRQLIQNIDTSRVTYNVSESVVTLVAGPGDDGAQLVCKAYSTNLPGTVLHDQTTLAVHYIPVATLNVATSQMPDHQSVKGGSAGEDEEGSKSGGRSRPGEKTSVTVREGTTVALTCHVVANPSVYNVTWFHNGKPVTGPRFGWGLRADSRLLRLRAIQRDKRGLYTCVASNDEGDGQSNAVNINVEYAPVCAAGQQQEYVVPRGSPVTVSCSVEAFPSSVTFTWAKKNLAAPPTRLPNVGRPEGSTGRYTVPAVFEDQLEVLCWAKNVVGAQKAPCSYYLYAQGRPGPVSNCSVSNHTATGFVVSCYGWPRRGNPLDANYTLLLYNQVGRSSSELMGEDLSGNLVPSVTNFNEKTKAKGQHHPGMTVAEIGLQRNTVDKTENAEAKEDAIPHSTVLTSLGDLVRNITSTEPFFIIGGLKGGREFAVVVSAANAEGVSPPVALSAFTLKDNAQTVIGLPGNIARLPSNIPIAQSESGSASIDKNGHGTLTSNYDTAGMMHKPHAGSDDGSAPPGTHGRSDGARSVIIPPIFLLLAGSLVAIIMVATIVIFTIRKRGQIRRRREAEQVKISDDQDYYQAHDSGEATTVLPITDSKRKISGGSGDMHSSDSDLTRLQGPKVSEDVLNVDCGGPLDGRGNQDGISSDSHEMLIAPTVACEKGINIIPLGEKPSTNFDASAVLASGGNSSFRVRPPLVSNDHLSHHSTKFGVPTSGILRRSCLNSTPNLATISGLTGSLEYNIASGRERGLGVADDADKSLGHTTLGRMPSFSKSRAGTAQPATLGRNQTGFAVLEVDRLRHGSPSRLAGMTVMSASFPSPPILPRRSGAQFPPTPPQISPRAPTQMQYQHDGSFLQSDYTANKIPTSMSTIVHDGESLSQQQATNFTKLQAAEHPITLSKPTSSPFPQDHLLPASLSPGTNMKNNISCISNSSTVPTANYGASSLATGIPVSRSGLVMVGAPSSVGNKNVTIGNDRVPASGRNDYPASTSSSEEAKRLQGTHIQGRPISVVPSQEIFSSHQSRETCDKEDVGPSVERANLSGSLRICSPSRSAMRHGSSGGPKPTVSFEIDEHVPDSQKMKPDFCENLSSL